MTALLANWRLIGLAAIGLVFLSLAVALKMERLQNAKLKAQLGKCEQFRRDLADRSDEKQKETARRVDQAKDRIVYVDRVARGIEAAPLPGNCRTPDAVMGADL